MICSKEKCTGCEACFCVCPKNAITMQEDDYGNIYPIIDNNKCIHCSMCKKVCPQLKEKLDFKTPMTAYAMYVKNIEKRAQSTSGGIASILYEKILEEDGIIYGASNIFGSTKNLHFIRIDNKEDLYKVKGSKYVHCHINGIYVNVKKDLLNNKKVLFIGTPCQVAGLRCFLMKEYDNLITADIICHGVPSQRLLFEQINELKIPVDEIKQIVFRTDNENIFNFKIIGNNNNIFDAPSYMIPYYKNFLEGNIYRENCYSCRFANKDRIADITLGDFWGLDKNSLIYDDEKKGISVVLANTEKGLKIIKQILEDCRYEKRTIDEAFKMNSKLNEHMKKSKKYEIYLKEYPKYGFKKTMNDMLTTKEKVKYKIKKSFLYKFYKKINS